MSLDLKLKITGESKEAVAAAKEALKSIEGIKTESVKASKESKALSDAIAGIKTESVKASKESKALSDAIAGIKSSVVGLVGLSAFTGLAKDILDTNRSMEALRAQLDSVTGSAESGARAFDFVKKFAVDTPFEIDGLTKSFISLKNFGIEPTKNVMDAMTNQAARLGASQETLSSIVSQLGQAYQKGKLQQEDMIILAERGVPIYELAAKALNKTGAEIAEMSAKGEMGRDAIDAIIKKMGELTAGSNERAMDTLNGKISNLSDSWTQFSDALLQDRSEGLIKSIVESSTNVLNMFTRNMTDTVDAQIATLEARMKTMEVMGAAGKGLAFLTGYDVDGQKAALEALKRQQQVKADADALVKIKEDSARAIAQTEEWLAEIEADGAKKSGNSSKLKSDNYSKMAASLVDSLLPAHAESKKLEEATRMLSDSFKAGEISLSDYNAAMSNLKTQASSSVQSLIDRLLPAQAETRRLKENTELLNEAFKNGNIDIYNYSDAMEALQQTGNSAFTSLMDRLYPVSAETRRLAEETQVLEDAFKQGRLGVYEYYDALDKLKESSEHVTQSLTGQREAVEALNSASQQATTDTTLATATSFVGNIMNSVLSDANGQRVTKSTLYSEAEAIHRDQLKGKDVTEAWDALNEKKRLFGFASGGSFMVGGSGGTDSQLVQFRASPNERVTIETPAQQKQSATSAVFNITMTGVQNVQQFVRELEKFSRTTPININVGTRQTVAG